MPVTCPWCSQLFSPKRPDRPSVYCSRSCTSKAVQAQLRSARPAPVLSAVCGCGCGQAMPEFDTHGRKRRYLYRHNPKTRPPSVCGTCGQETTHRGATKFCSRACSAKSRAQTKVDLICLICAQDYLVFPFRATSSRYCSRACWGSRGAVACCLNCGADFKVDGNKGMYCSRACAHQHMVGDRASAWKDGRSLHNERARYASKLREWRLAVYARDDYRCQDCGARGYLHAHHIKFWSTHPDLRFVIENGKTLCIDCHGLVHGRNFTPRKPPTKPRRRPAESRLPQLAEPTA